MSSSLILLLMIGTLFGVALGSGLIIFLFQQYQNPEPTPIQLRLMELKAQRQDKTSALQSDALKKLANLFKETDYKNENLGKRLEKFHLFLKLKILLQQAGITTPPDQFLMKTVFPAGLILILGIVTQFLPLFLLSPGYLGVVYVFVLFKRNRRYSRFVSQLPDSLSMVTTALRAGHSFQSALTVVSTEMPEPTATEFGLMVKDINLGIPVKESLGRLMVRMETLPDVRMFCTAVNIQRESGGNLAEVLENLGRTIRERFKLKGQIAALTGQSRLTGYVLGAAPLIMLGILSFIFYGYVAPLYETEIGHYALILALILQIIGLVIIRKIIDIRV